MKDLTERTVLDHVRALEKREYSSAELVSAYLERISKEDGELGAFLEVCGMKALKEAERADMRRKNGEPLGAFDGIPFAVKDNICTDGIRTSCGSKFLRDYKPPYNATVLENLFKHGMIMIGKTNMDEFGMGSSGENSAFYPTRNPLDRSKVPGGSSSGSAAAVAAALAPIALGSDTGGSARQPAAFCGVVGMKPTYGRVSRYGLVAFAPSLEQISPISRDVSDNAALLSLMIGQDRMDTMTYGTKGEDLSADIGKDLKGLRIALVGNYLCGEISEEVRIALKKAAGIFCGLGAKVDVIDIPCLKFALPAYYVISSAEAASNLSRFDGIRYGHRTENYSSLEELYVRSRTEGFGDEVKRRIMLGNFVLSHGYKDEYYKRAQNVRVRIRHEIEKLFENYDILLMPTAPTGAYGFAEKRVSDAYSGDLCTVVANITGMPAISLPSGKDNKSIGIGIQLMAGLGEEALLYRAAYAYEREAEND